MFDHRYDFQKLTVYRKAMDFVEEVFGLSEEFPQKVQFSLGEQLRRAALSICNNLAERSQKTGAAKRQFYGYALHSSRECVPMLELAFRRRLIGEEKYRQLTDQCFQIGNMTYGLISKVS